MNEIKTITNKALNNQLTTIKTEMLKTEKSLWKIANAYAKIVEGELFKEDFGNLENFGKYVGVSKSTISRMVNASKAKRELELCDDYTTSQIIELLPCKENIVDCIETTGVTPADTQKEIREKVKKYLGKDTPSKTETTETETTETETEIVDNNETDLKIVYQGKNIIVTGTDYIKITKILADYID